MRISLMVIACVLLLSVGTAQAQRYIDNRDSTLSDTKTGLMWEKKTAPSNPKLRGLLTAFVKSKTSRSVLMSTT